MCVLLSDIPVSYDKIKHIIWITLSMCYKLMDGKYVYFEGFTKNGQEFLIFVWESISEVNEKKNIKNTFLICGHKLTVLENRYSYT